VSIFLHFCNLLCIVSSTPMRFPRVKAEGQSFYHCVSKVVSEEIQTVCCFSIQIQVSSRAAR
jgi:hypothetical protein